MQSEESVARSDWHRIYHRLMVVTYWSQWIHAVDPGPNQLWTGVE